MDDIDVDFNSQCIKRCHVPGYRSQRSCTVQLAYGSQQADAVAARLLLLYRVAPVLRNRFAESPGNMSTNVSGPDLIMRPSLLCVHFLYRVKSVCYVLTKTKRRYYFCSCGVFKDTDHVAF